MSERFRWARAHTEYFPWGIELVTGLVATTLTVVLVWQRQNGDPTFKAFLESAVFWDYAIPVIVGVVVAFILTPAAGFAKNLAGAESCILGERLTEVWRDNVQLASMVDATEHKNRDTHDLLVRLVAQGRKLRDFWAAAANRGVIGYSMVETIVTQYAEWYAESADELKTRLRHNEFNQLMDCRFILPEDYGGRLRMGTHACFEEFFATLRRRIDMMDGLIGSEYSPPHGVFWTDDQYVVTARYHARDTEGPPSPPIPESGGSGL